MSNFWQGFTKKAGIFGSTGIHGKETLEEFRRLNKHLEDYKDIFKEAPGRFEQAGKNVAQASKKLDRGRLFGYAALAGSGLAMGTALGRHFGQNITKDEKLASMITHALKKGLRRGRNSASGTIGKGGYRMGKTTIRYPKNKG